MTATSMTRYAATVAVRVPRDSGPDLATAVSRRLAHAPAVENAEVEGLCGLEPSLSATVVTARVTVAVDPAAAVGESLAAAPGVEGVDRAERAGRDGRDG